MRNNQLSLGAWAFVIAVLVLIIAATGSVFTWLALRRVDDIATQVRRQAVKNEVEVLEHRLRSEQTAACPTLYLQALLRAREEAKPFSEVPLPEFCLGRNLPELDRKLAEARRRFAPLRP